MFLQSNFKHFWTLIDVQADIVKKLHFSRVRFTKIDWELSHKKYTRINSSTYLECQ